MKPGDDIDRPNMIRRFSHLIQRPHTDEAAGHKGSEATKALMTIYDLLLEHFGPQNWWPAETPFEVALGAILTQQVSWKNVELAINNLKRLELLDPQKIRSLPLEILEKLIRPTGFYKTKAKKIKAFVGFLCERFDGSMDKMFETPAEDLRKALLSVYGIGPETADSILLYAGGVPVFVVDAYTIRLLERINLPGNDPQIGNDPQKSRCMARRHDYQIDYSPPSSENTMGRHASEKPRAHTGGPGRKNFSYESAQSLFHAALPRDAALFNEFHALIVALCKHICRLSDPNCKVCPIVRICSYGRRVSYREGESETSGTEPKTSHTGSL